VNDHWNRDVASVFSGEEEEGGGATIDPAKFSRLVGGLSFKLVPCRGQRRDRPRTTDGKLNN